MPTKCGGSRPGVKSAAKIGYLCDAAVEALSLIIHAAAEATPTLTYKKATLL